MFSTYGWTPFEKRVPVDHEFLSRIASMFTTVREGGGRFFINRDGAYHRCCSGGDVQFVEFEITETLVRDFGDIEFGVVYARPIGEEDWTRLGTAQGLVAVAEEHELKVEIRSDIEPEDLQWLPADGLASLDLAGTRVDDDALKYIGHLSSLRELNLGCC